MSSRPRRRRRIGGVAGIAITLFTLFAGFLGSAYAVARDIGDKIECHAFQLIAKEILARGGPGATTIKDLGEQDLCNQPYSMAQAMCQDLLDLDVCSLKQLVTEKICPAVDACQTVVDWFTNTKIAAKTWLVTRLQGAASWLVDHAKVAWGAVSAAVRGTQAALRGDSSPGASDAQASEPGAELDDQIAEAEGGGDPGAAPNDGVPGLEPPESDTDLKAGEADCESGCSAQDLATDTADARDATVVDAVGAAETAAKATGKIASAVRVASRIAGVGLRVAGWVGMGLMAYDFISELVQGYQVSDQTQAAGFHDYSPEDLWYPKYSSCATAYDIWAQVLQDPTSVANLQFIGSGAGNNDPEMGIVSYTEAAFAVNAFLDATTGGLAHVSQSWVDFLPPNHMSLLDMYLMEEGEPQSALDDPANCPVPDAASPADVAVIRAAYIRDLDVAGYDGAWLLANPSHLSDQEPISQEPTWCFPAGYATVQDLQSVDVADGHWGEIAQVLSGQLQCPAGPTQGSPLRYQPAAAYTQLVGDLRSGNDGPYDQLLAEAQAVAASGGTAPDPTGNGPIAADAGLAISALEALPAKANATVTALAQDPAGPATAMSTDDAVALLLATSDVLGSGDPTRVATAYVETDPTSAGDSGTVIAGSGGNIGATALLASQMVTGYAQASPDGTLDPSSADDQYLATAANLAGDLNAGGGDLNQAYAAYVSQNHLPPYAGAWAGGYSQDPAQTPSDISQGSELNAGNWGLEAGAYQGSPPTVPTAYLLTLSAADWEGWLDADDLGNQPVQPPQDLLHGQPLPPSDLLAIFEDASETYDTSLPLLLAIAAQQSGFTAQCEPIGTAQEQQGSDVGVMGMATGIFTSTKAPPGLDMGATAADATGTPLTLDGRTWRRSDTLPGDDPATCPLLGEEAGMLDPTSEIDVAASLLHQDGGTSDASSDQLRGAAQSFYDHGVTGLEGTGLIYAQPWAQSVVLVRYPAYVNWLSGGAPTTGSAGCSGPIGKICPEPETPVFPWVSPGGYPTTHMDTGQCTWWAAYNSWAVSAYGIRGDANGSGGDSWIASAESVMPAGTVLLGGTPNAVPQVGEIVVYRPGWDGSDPSLGHVAVVVAVDPDPGQPQGISGYWISEMNFIYGLGRVDERHLAWPDPGVGAFILGMPPGVGG